MEMYVLNYIEYTYTYGESDVTLKGIFSSLEQTIGQIPKNYIAIEDDKHYKRFIKKTYNGTDYIIDKVIIDNKVSIRLY